MTKAEKAENAKNARKFREHRVSKGLCTRCGKINDRQPLHTCSECAEKSKAYKGESTKLHAKNFRDRRIKSNLCMTCGDPLDRSGRVCQKCVEVQRERGKKRYYELKEKGLCVSCAKPLDIKGIHCASCKLIKENQRNSRVDEPINKKKDKVVVISTEKKSKIDVLMEESRELQRVAREKEKESIELIKQLERDAYYGMRYREFVKALGGLKESGENFKINIENYNINAEWIVFEKLRGRVKKVKLQFRTYVYGGDDVRCSYSLVYYYPDNDEREYKVLQCGGLTNNEIPIKYAEKFKLLKEMCFKHKIENVAKKYTDKYDLDIF